MAKSKETKAKQSAQSAKPEAVETAPSRGRMACPPCPNSPMHQARRVYSTRGKVRYCVCDTCGHTWKAIDRESTEPHVVMAYDELAMLLDLPAGAEICHVGQLSEDAELGQFRVFYRLAEEPAKGQAADAKGQAADAKGQAAGESESGDSAA